MWAPTTCFLFHMEFLNGTSSSSSSSSTTTSYQTHKVEPGFNLLEECWFFGNLLTSAKPKMSRCNSDPFPSTTTNQQQDNANSLSLSTKNGNNFVQPVLVRAPSLPTSFLMAKSVEAIQQSGGHEFSGEIMKSKAQVSLARHTLLRAPSLPLPPCLGSEEDEEEEDQESDFKLGRLIRQASLNSSQTLPPRQTSKSTSVPRRPRRKVVMEGNKETRQQYQINKTKGKWPTDLQKLKALSSQLEKQSLDDDVSKKVSSTLETKSWDEVKQKKATRPYQFSEASSWHKNELSTTTIPNWSSASAAENEKRLPQDMKAQIKFWARAVASNARPPGVS